MQKERKKSSPLIGFMANACAEAKGAYQNLAELDDIGPPNLISGAVSQSPRERLPAIELSFHHPEPKYAGCLPGRCSLQSCQTKR